MRPGVNLPIVDFLCELPVAAVGGSCFAADRRPELASYIYALVPTSTSTATCWRISPAAKSIQQLPSPNRDAATVFGVGTSMILDESLGFLWLFTPQSTTAAGLEWARFQYLDLNNLAGGWVQRTVVGLGLAAQWATSAALCHPCTAILNVADGADDHIYLCGHDGAVGGAGPSRLGRFGIAGNAWATVTGAGGARGGAPGAGSSLNWNPSRNGILYSIRGGGTVNLDAYDIATNAWAAADPTPATETWGVGTETWTWLATHIPYMLVSQGGKVRLADLPLFGNGGGIVPLVEIDGTDGAEHAGNSLCAYQVGEKVYIIIRPHSGKAIQRIRPIL